MNKIFLFLTLTFITLTINAQQKNKKAVIKVEGNCSMCKSRIEKASIKLKGVKYALWSPITKELSLIIDESKCDTLKIKKTITGVGHDTYNLEAKKEVYNALPACCKYRDPNSIHMNHKKVKKP